MVIYPNTNDTSWEPELYAKGEKMEVVSSYKFLGVDIDKGLRFNEHIERIVTKCRKRVNILRCLAGKDWGNSPESMRRMYIKYIRSVLEYRSSSWAPWISKTNLQKLEHVKMKHYEQSPDWQNQHQ